MKALGLALLLANVLYLAWSQWLGSDGPAVADSAPPANVPKLILATEAKGADERGGAAAQARGLNETTSPGVDADSSPASDTDAAPAASTPAPVDTSSPRTRSAELMTGVQRCLSIGPFRDLAEATQGSAALRTAGHDPRTRVAEGDVWAGLWVHLAGLPTRTEAQRAVTLLKQRGIGDAYIMPAAGRGADISLGIFSEPARAQRRADEVRAMGFTPTIADRTRQGTVYWIDVDLKPTDGFIDPSTIPSEQGKITRLEVQACPAADS